MSEMLNPILDAHGGLAYWESLDRIEVEFSAEGFLFTSKGIPPQRHARITVCTTRPEVTIHDYPQPGQTTRWLGDARVEVVDGGGRVVQSRERPRAAFGSWRKFFRWDALDFAYFSSYAMWGYLTAPFLFRREGVAVQTEPAGQGGTHLALTFPPDLPVHCAQQEFWFDASGHLLRLDYTAEVVGSWATAAHFCDEYRTFGGLSLPTRRRVYPKLLFGKPIRALTLVAIDIHNVVPHLKA